MLGVMFSALTLALSLAWQGPAPAFDPGPHPLLLRNPTMSKDAIVFEFAGDLWRVGRDGGQATRLTGDRGIEARPHFSPDGKWITFTGFYDGNADVFVMPAEGGVPKRLTAHPDQDIALGWMPDGKSVVFASSMLSATDLPRLFTVSVNGGFPKPVELPSGSQASMSPDGTHIAYVPGIKWSNAWKRYRGGQTFPIWIADLADGKWKEIPRKNTNDENPMWVGNKIYYLSDPTGPVGLNSYDTATGKETVEIPGNGFDIKSASEGPGGIVYAKLTGIHVYDPATKSDKAIPIDVKGDFPEVRTQFKDLTPNIQGLGVSPTGQRVVVTARGWAMTVPVDKGDARALSDKQGVNRRDPAWSPDGRTIAYITDARGGQQLALYDNKTGEERILPLGGAPGYYDNPVWSPDSTKIAYIDNKFQLWTIDVRNGNNTKIDKAGLSPAGFTPHWSPDSSWLTYNKQLPNYLNAVFVYEIASGKTTQITDGLADAISPVFDRNGKYLYFLASTDVGPAASWLDISSYTQANVTYSVYAAVLKKDTPNPLAPESDEEPMQDATPPLAPAKPAVGTKEGEKPKPAEAPKIIDLDGIEARIISLPLPAAPYANLEPGPANSFFALRLPLKRSGADRAVVGSLVKFDFNSRRAMPFAAPVTGFVPTADGSKIALLLGPSISVVSAMAPPQPGQGRVDLSGLRMRIDPKAEWRQMFDEIWRDEPMLFYADNLHGIDPKVMHDRYAPFVDGVASRADFNYLISDMMGEVSVGHMFPGGGDIPQLRDFVPGGLLGADYRFENGRYRLTRVYDGERWNPDLYAPLAQPGVLAKAGEYILAIDGKDLTDSTDIYEALEDKAGKQVKVKIGPTPDGKEAREVTVVPVADEQGLRQRAWAEDNRRYVEKMTNGRGGYVHVPDTNVGGWTEFTRYYYAQTGKDGIVVDERFNHGGLINDFMVREMQITPAGAFAPRYGTEMPTPAAAIYGPKVMLVNQWAGSGGDMFPWLFKHAKVGKIVGKRTWGGLIAAASFPLMDGGSVNAPDWAFFDPETGKWDVEGYGVDPDIEVELDPYLWRQGRDSQLERAVAELNKQLATYKKPTFKRPPYPVKTGVNGRF
ncbi:S41 family peptidase [soil metagenome]